MMPPPFSSAAVPRPLRRRSLAAFHDWRQVLMNGYRKPEALPGGPGTSSPAAGISSCRHMHATPSGSGLILGIRVWTAKAQISGEMLSREQEHDKRAAYLLGRSAVQAFFERALEGDHHSGSPLRLRFLPSSCSRDSQKALSQDQMQITSSKDSRALRT